MRVVVAGGSGFLGRALTDGLVAKGHEPVVLTRGGERAAGATRYVHWDPDGSAAGTWIREIDGADAIVNLSGENLGARRWTGRRKDQLRESRILATRTLVSAVRAAPRRPAVFVQGSGAGYYGFAGEEVLDESFPPGQDFLGQLAVAWEAEAHPAAALGCRLVFVRSGVVLSNEAEAVRKLRLPFKLFVGGPLGSGRQYFSWIHRDDWVALVTWAIEHESVFGVFNATAPGPVTNAEFSAALGRSVNRPSWLRVPAFALRILLGEMADGMLLNGQRVVPKRAMDQGFVFKYPAIDAALQHA